MNLIDLPLEGGSYTWSSNQDNLSMFQINRFLVSREYEYTAVTSLPIFGPFWCSFGQWWYEDGNNLLQI